MVWLILNGLFALLISLVTSSVILTFFFTPGLRAFTHVFTGAVVRVGGIVCCTIYCFFPPITNCVRKGKVSLCLWMTFGVSDSGNVNNLQQHFSRLEITRTPKRGAWKFVLRYWSPERGLFYPRIKSHGETSGRKVFALNCYTNGVKESFSVASVECIVTGHS